MGAAPEKCCLFPVAARQLFSLTVEREMPSCAPTVSAARRTFMNPASFSTQGLGPLRRETFDCSAQGRGAGGLMMGSAELGQKASRDAMNGFVACLLSRGA